MSALQYRSVLSGDERMQICRDVLEDLPEWFGQKEALAQYVEEAADQSMIACFQGATPIGMLCLKSHTDRHVEVAVLGVCQSFHRKGIGAALIQRARDAAIGMNAVYLSVKTLSASSADPYYAATRAFYGAQGFEVFEEFTTIWGAGNPCVLMLQVLHNG